MYQTHLVWNTRKGLFYATKSISSYWDDVIAQCFQIISTLTIDTGAFPICECPPEIFFCVGISGYNSAPWCLFGAFSKVDSINNEMNWSGMVLFFWRLILIKKFSNCSPIYAVFFAKFTECLFVEYIFGPKLFLKIEIDFPLTAESSFAVMAFIRLDTSFTPTLSCIKKPALRASYSFF